MNNIKILVGFSHVWILFLLRRVLMMYAQKGECIDNELKA